MKVLFVIDSLGGGGSQRQLVNVATGFKERGHQVSVLTYHQSEWHLPRLIEACIEYECHQKLGRFSVQPILKLHQKYGTFEPDVVVAFLRTPSVYAEMLRPITFGIPLIVSERAGVEADGLKWTDVLAGLGHMLASHVTANSHDYLERLNRLLPLKHRSTVIYNGIEGALFARGKDRLAQGPRRTANRFCVVAARVTRQKGPMPLAKALASLAARRADFVLDWVGPVDESYPLVQEVRQAIADRNLDAIWTWCGPHKNVSQVYGHYDALVLPSLYEGVANSMCEAMASGLPVIVTDVADNRRIVRDGIDGLVCAPDDPRSLAEALDRFMSLDSDARYAMASSAHDRAHELFTIGRLVHQWETLCFSVIQKNESV